MVCAPPPKLLELMVVQNTKPPLTARLAEITVHSRLGLKWGESLGCFCHLKVRLCWLCRPFTTPRLPAAKVRPCRLHHFRPRPRDCSFRTAIRSRQHWFLP